MASSHSAGGFGQFGPDRAEHGRDARADVADDRRIDADVAVRLLRRDVDLDELLAAPFLGAVAAPRLALAVRKQPVQARTDHHHDVGFRQHVRARRGCGLLVRVGQQALGHRHGQVGDAGLFHQRANIRIGLRVRRALAENDERTLGAPEQIERALHGVRRRDLARRRIDDLDQRLLPRFRVDRLREQLGRQVEIDAARTAGESGTDRPRHAHADVLGVQDPERGLGVRPRDGELVHLLVVALLQVDDLALARAADEDHRKAVGGGVGERRQSVEKAGGGHREADARLARHEAGDGSGIPGVLLMAEGDHAQSGALQLAREVGDRDAGQPEDRIDAVQLEGVDDELKAVGFLWLAIDLAAAGDFQRVFGGRRRLADAGCRRRRRPWCPPVARGNAGSSVRTLLGLGVSGIVAYGIPDNVNTRSNGMSTLAPRARAAAAGAAADRDQREPARPGLRRAEAGDHGRRHLRASRRDPPRRAAAEPGARRVAARRSAKR